MKEETVIILLLAGVAAYLAFAAAQPNKKMTILGGKAAPTNDGLLTVDVDGNMTAQDISSTAAAWNAAGQADDLNAIATLINSLRAAGHPVAADSLSAVLQKIQTINARPVAALSAQAQGWR